MPEYNLMDQENEEAESRRPSALTWLILFLLICSLLLPLLSPLLRQVQRLTVPTPTLSIPLNTAYDILGWGENNLRHET